MEENKNRILQVGDVLYLASQYSISSVCTIDRVTKSMAFSGAIKFKREFCFCVTCVGSNRWSVWSYYIETPELKEKYERRQLVEKIQGVKLFKNISTETLRQIVSLLNSEQKPEPSVARDGEGS